MTNEVQPADVDRFGTVVTMRLGLEFEDSKRPSLRELLNERLRATGNTAAVYLERLETGRAFEELRELAPKLTVGETYFFRSRAQIHAFEAVCREELQRGEEFRVLSAGCASGEEPYSLAITMAEHREQLDLRRFSIHAFDVNPFALAKARAARFSTWSIRDTEPGIIRRWFRPEGREFELSEEIRSFVTLEERNLADPATDFWRPGIFRAIFCRNVLMYFAPQKAQAVVARLFRSLAPGGLLFLGYAETLRGLSEGFDLCHTHETFYYRRREEGAASPASATPIQAAATAAATLEQALEGGIPWVDAIQRASDRVAALSRHSLSPAAPSEVDSVRSASARWDRQVVLDLLREERFQEALSLLSELPPEAQQELEILQLKSSLLIQAGRRTDAEQLAWAILKIDESNSVAHYLLALCHELAGAFASAIDHDRTAIYLDPTFSMPRLHLGILERRANRKEAARKELSEALRLFDREDASRLLLFGGGFGRDVLRMLCRSELAICGGRP